MITSRLRGPRSRAGGQALRAAALPVVVAVAVALIGCGGGSSGGGTINADAVARFTPSETGAAANRMRLVGGTASGDEVTVRVVLGGPSDEDLWSFAFELVLSDTEVAEYVSGSAAPGSVLDGTGCDGISVQAAQVNNRILVGVTKLGVCPGNGLTGGEPPIVSLTFRVLQLGDSQLSILPDPDRLVVALDSVGDPIPDVTWDSASATLAGI